MIAAVVFMLYLKKHPVVSSNEQEAKEAISSMPKIPQPPQNIQQPVKRRALDGSDSFHSDGVNMVMDLFDGKFIE